MILLLLSYDNPQSYSDPDTPQVYGTSYDAHRFEFNEATETVAAMSGGSYDDFQNNNPPVGFSFAGEFFDKCTGTTRQSYVHDGNGGFTVTPQPNSLSCGFVPPNALTCALVLAHALAPTATGATLTATATGAHGTVRYRLDGGPLQLSNLFYNVAPGPRVLSATDTGLSSCTRTVSFTVATPGAPAPAAGPSQGVDFVLQPLWYAVGAPAGAEVVLELYAESRHQADDFALVLRLRRRADAAGRVSFRLDPLLAPLLQATTPPVSTAATVVCRAALLNYFVRTATVSAAGLPASLVTGPLRTALRGGLPAEHRGGDFFADQLEATGLPSFLSWQPAGKRLTPEQPEWLGWLCPDDAPAQFVVRRSYVRTGFAGGAPLVEDEAVDLRGGRGPAGRLLAIPVRPRAAMDSVSVALLSTAGAALSPVVTYAIGAATPRSRYLLFTNSLGHFDTLRTEGRLEAVLEASADRYELPARPGGPAPAAERQAFEVSAARKLKLATGWLTAPELRWLQELVLAREVWQLRGGRLLPLELAKRQLAYEADDAPLRGLLLEFDYAYEPTAHAALP